MDLFTSKLSFLDVHLLMPNCSPVCLPLLVFHILFWLQLDSSKATVFDLSFKNCVLLLVIHWIDHQILILVVLNSAYWGSRITFGSLPISRDLSFPGASPQLPENKVLHLYPISITISAFHLGFRLDLHLFTSLLSIDFQPLIRLFAARLAIFPPKLGSSPQAKFHFLP